MTLGSHTESRPGSGCSDLLQSPDVSSFGVRHADAYSARLRDIERRAHANQAPMTPACGFDLPSRLITESTSRGLGNTVAYNEIAAAPRINMWKQTLSKEAKSMIFSPRAGMLV